MALWSEVGDILSAFATMDSWEIRNALKANGAWVFGAIATAICGLLVLWIYKLIPWLDRHLERTIMVYSYLAIAFIIFWGVIDRFIFSNQQPWSTTIPPLLFMIMAWFGAAFNVRLRTHLSFAEFRTAMPRIGQICCLSLDAVLWFIFAVIMVVTTTRATALVYQDGILVRTGATTRRYLGTVRTDGSTQFEDTATQRFVWNLQNAEKSVASTLARQPRGR